MDVNLQAEWGNVSGAPLIFLGTVLIVSILIWVALHFLHRNKIEDLESRLKLRDDEIARLERNAAAPTGSAIVPAPTVESLPPKASAETKGASPQKPAPEKSKADSPARQPPAPESRVFLGESVTPSFLMGLCGGKTALQAKRSTAMYIGKWMRVVGTINNMSDHDHRIFVSVKVPANFRGEESSTLVWLDFRGDRDRLEVMGVGDKIVAIGEIETIKEREMDFEHCELAAP